jgi:hypothetical protein
MATDKQVAEIVYGNGFDLRKAPLSAEEEKELRFKKN